MTHVGSQIIGADARCFTGGVVTVVIEAGGRACPPRSTPLAPSLSHASSPTMLNHTNNHSVKWLWKKLTLSISGGKLVFKITCNSNFDSIHATNLSLSNNFKSILMQKIAKIRWRKTFFENVFCFSFLLIKLVDSIDLKIKK